MSNSGSTAMWAGLFLLFVALPGAQPRALPGCGSHVGESAAACKAAAADVPSEGLELIQKGSSRHPNRAFASLQVAAAQRQQRQQEHQQQEQQQDEQPRKLSVYVYDIPRSVPRGDLSLVVRDDCNTPDTHGCVEDLTVGSEEWRVALFGHEQSIPLADGRTVECHKIHAYSNSRIMLSSLRLSPTRASDPDKADLFWIPIFTEDWKPNVTTCPTPEEILQFLPHLNEENAGRHIWLQPTPGWYGEVCPAFYTKSTDESVAGRLLSKVTKLSVEDPVVAPESVFWNETALLSALIRVPWAPPISENQHSVPYASVVSGLNDSALEAWQQAAFGGRKRTNLISVSLGMHGMMSAYPTRGAIKRLCDSRPDACAHKDIGIESTITPDTFEYIVSEQLEAEFCLEPVGDTVSRKGIIDSLVSGCIPVLFNLYQAKLWPWHVGNWEDVAITFDGVPEDFIDTLEKIPQERREQMRANMAKLFPRLVVHEPGDNRPGDYLDTILQHVYDLNTQP